MDWHITEADINKDIKVSDLFSFYSNQGSGQASRPSFQNIHQVNGKGYCMQDRRKQTS
jgi:hypothetical protein